MVNVTARPDPTANPNVRAISDAQAEATRRFSRAQVSNFLQRAESLHGVECGRSANGLRISSTDRRYDDRLPGEQYDPAQEGARRQGQRRDRPNDRAADGEASPAGQRCASAVAVWAGGTVDIGTRDAVAGRSKVSATTSGVSAGVDTRIAKGVTLGLGVGLGHDGSDIDGGKAHVSADTKVIALYGSLTPMPGLFVDGLLAHGWLDFDTRRIDLTTGIETRGRRKGRYTTGALSAGIDRIAGPLQWSLYGRAEYMGGKLNAYRENGAGIYDLRFDDRDLNSLTGALGFKASYRTPVDFGIMTARLRGEWLHEFTGGTRQGLDYADVLGDSYYSLDAQGWSREQFTLAPGVGLALPSGWDFGIDLGVRAASARPPPASMSARSSDPAKASDAC